MSVNGRIKVALAFLGYEIFPNVYDGKNDIYFVFNVNVMPTDFGNNEPSHNINYVQLHFFCPLTFNSLQIRKQIKKALLRGEFTYPEEIDASDKDGQHIVFECEEAEGIE